MQEARFPEKLKGKYKYMPLPNSGGKVDVMIYRFREEVEKEDGEKEYIYDYNSFRTSKLTEAEIKADPYSYLDYTEEEKTEKEEIEELKEEVKKLKEKVENFKQNQ